MLRRLGYWLSSFALLDTPTADIYLTLEMGDALLTEAGDTLLWE